MLKELGLTLADFKVAKTPDSDLKVIKDLFKKLQPR